MESVAFIKRVCQIEVVDDCIISFYPCFFTSVIKTKAASHGKCPPPKFAPTYKSKNRRSTAKHAFNVPLGYANVSLAS